MLNICVSVGLNLSIYPWFHDSVSCFINQMLSSLGSSLFDCNPRTVRPLCRKSQEVKAIYPWNFLKYKFYHLFIFLQLTKIIIPVAQVEGGKAKRKDWSGQNVYFLGSEFPCGHPELELVTHSRGCGGGEDRGRTQVLLRPLDPSYKWIILRGKIE